MTVNTAVGNCAQKIRQIAGINQCCGNLKDAKRSVDLALRELGCLNRKQPELQIISWEQLRLSLASYLNCCSDIRWLTVIKYARAKAGSRRAAAVHNLKKNQPVTTVSVSYDRIDIQADVSLTFQGRSTFSAMLLPVMQVYLCRDDAAVACTAYWR